MKRKAGIETVAIATMILLAGLLLIIQEPTITGHAIVPSYCFAKEACIDLNGDMIVDYKDEDIFAQLLTNETFRNENPDLVALADFDGDGQITQRDFQECFVPLRDYYVDNNKPVTCNPEPDELTERINREHCLHGCPDLNGDGFVDDRDFNLMMKIINGELNIEKYPMADLTGDGKVGIEDKFCLTPYMDTIVMCNLPRQRYHTTNCPDLTSTIGIGTDGIVNEDDYILFLQYKEEQNLKADFNGDGVVDWKDQYIFEQYYNPEIKEPRVVDCALYHAPWHIGGIDQSNSNTSAEDFDYIGGTNNATQEFTTTREGQLAKIRFYMNATEGVQKEDIIIRIYPDAGGQPNTSILIPPETTILSFDKKEKHWQTAYFKQPPVLEENKTYHIVMTSEESNNIAYRWMKDTTSNIYEVFTSTACADLNGDGIVGARDEEIINRIPDGISIGGSSTWNASMDVNNDHVINETDLMLVEEAYLAAGGFALRPELYQDYGTSGAGQQSFGSTKGAGQLFTANDTKTSIIELQLKSTATAKRDIIVEVWSSKINIINETHNETISDQLMKSTTIKGFSETNYKFYNATLNNALELEIGKEYFLILASPQSTTQIAYQWRESANPGISSYRLYNGHPQYNEAYDVNNDGIVDQEDAELIAALIPSYDGLFWTPLVDFNAVFGVYERLRDKTLGFDAYMGKVLSCGLPTWTVSDGDGRCDWKYENYSTTTDCPTCNKDGFCSITEDHLSCPEDCTLPTPIPRYWEFDGETTDFESIEDLSNIEGAILEKTGYGKIEFLEPLNLEVNETLDFNKYVTIEYNNISINITALPQLNKSAKITLYNLTKEWPRIFENQESCEKDNCEFKSYNKIWETEYSTLVFSITSWNYELTTFRTKEKAPKYEEYKEKGETSSFHRSMIAEIEEAEGIILDKPTKGKIIFLEKINASKLDIDNEIKIEYAKIKINSTREINKSAAIEFYNLNKTYPEIYKEEKECKECIFINYVENNLRYQIEELTNYTIEEMAPDVTKFNGTTTNFKKGIITNINEVENMILEIENKGKIKFLEPINASKGNYTRDVEINLNGETGGWVKVDSEIDPRLNKSAEITLYNLNLHTPRIILENGTDCPKEICEIISYGTECNNDCTLKFNVTQFTKYQAIENTTDPQFINGPIETLIWNATANYTINISYYFFDVDNETLIYDVEISNPNVDAIINNEKGIITLYSINTWSGTGHINFSATDGNGTAKSNQVLFVVMINRPPQLIKQIPNQIWDEDTNITIDLEEYFTDPDNDKLKFEFKCTGADYCEGEKIKNITVEINGSIATLIPDKNWNSEFRGYEGKRYLFFIAKDPQYSTNSNIIELEVISVNDPPTQKTTIEDKIINQYEEYIMNLEEYFEDVEDYIYEMNYEMKEEPINFNVTINENVTINFTPKDYWYGYEEFQIVVTDRDNASIISNKFRIFVLQVEKDLIRTDKEFNLTWYQDEELEINLKEYFFDPDNNAVYFARVENHPNPNMTIFINHLTGNVRFVPKKGWFGIVGVNLSAEDTTSKMSEYVNLTVMNKNKPPQLNLTELNDMMLSEKSEITIDLLDYVYDPNTEDLLNMSWNCETEDNNLTVYIEDDYLTLIAGNYSGTKIVNCTVTDPGGLSDNDSFTVRIFFESTIINSYIEGEYYNGSYGDITGIFESTINDSSIIDSEITISEIQNSTIIDSKIENCTIINSTVKNTFCKDGIINPSEVINSDTTGSIIKGSYIKDSNATYSTITNSTIKISDVNNSKINNTKKCKIYLTTIKNAEIDSCKIENGTITYRNNTIYDAEVLGEKNLTDIINYKPTANFNYTTNYLEVIFTDMSTDPNIGTELEDEISYLWNFGDGSNSTIQSPTHTYATAGTYNVSLIVEDKENQTDEYMEIITVTRAVQQTTGGGGGGRTITTIVTCTPMWRCDEWTECIEGERTRECRDINNCNTEEGKPIEKEICEIICVEEWECGDWSICTTAGRQTRTCIDKNSCGTTEKRPIMMQECEYIPTCYDGIQNQGEEGIDCGGPCPPCPEPIVEMPTREMKTGLYTIIFLLIIATLSGLGYLLYDKYNIEKQTKIAPIAEKEQRTIIKEKVDINLRLKKYVQMTMEAGFPKEKIKKRLKEEGWSEKEIERAFK